ncbi:hypothetical protein MPSEU_000068100 [Mayamaea pseudoterrestris]|nr:hypothetical protein MPSEU_000068100 [Mayamaea pseudoterrestris]
MTFFSSTTQSSTVSMEERSLNNSQWSLYYPSRKILLLATHTLATLFSILALTQCSFMIENTQNVSSSAGLVDKIQVGLYSRSIYDNDTGAKLGCVQYTDHDDFDSMLKAGRAFGTFTALFSCTSLACLLTVLCCLPRRSGKLLWSLGKYLLMTATVSQMFTFFALGSDYLCQVSDCKLTGVGILSSFNVIILGTAAAMYYLESVPTTAWLAWWQESPTHHLERTTTPKASNKRVNLQNKYAYDRSHAKAARATINACPEAAMEELDPYNLPPSFAIEAAGRNSNANTIMGWRSQRIFRITLLCLFLVSWLLSIIGVQRCTFMLVGPSNGSQDNFSGVGLFSRGVYYRGKLIGCVDYPHATRMDFDAPFQAGRIFGGVTAFLMTFICLLKLWQVFAHRARREIWLMIRLLLPCATFSQLLTFFVYKTETCSMNDLVDCVPGKLGVWVILNVLLMVSLCVIVISVPPPDGPLISIVDASKFLPVNSSTVSDHAPSKVFRSKDHLPEPKGMNISQQAGREAQLQDEAAISNSYRGGASHVPSERIVNIQPLDADVEKITVTVEYSGNEKKTIKVLTHPDGSQTITTTLEEIDDDATNCDECEYSIGGSCLSYLDGNPEDVSLDEEVIQLRELYHRSEQGSCDGSLLADESRATSRQVLQTLDPQLHAAAHIGEFPDQAFIQVNTSDDLD